MSRYDYWDWRPYVPVAERRHMAMQKMEKLRKKGQVITPVRIAGRTIADTFWGKAWCENLEAYSDFANRLPRGRTYVRNGSVVDLQIDAARVTAMVSGSELYTVEIGIRPLDPQAWKSIRGSCLGKIGSLVELLHGKLSRDVMEIVTRPRTGLFPAPAEITLKCSCPDWAAMCKHVAAALYGVGARLDHEPELLFRLRDVDHRELIAVPEAADLILPGAAKEKLVAEDELAGIFGIELDSGVAPVTPEKAGKRKRGRPTGKAKLATPVAAPAVPVRSTKGRKPLPGKAKPEQEKPKRGRPPGKAKPADPAAPPAPTIPAKSPRGRKPLPRKAASAVVKPVRGSKVSPQAVPPPARPEKPKRGRKPLPAPAPQPPVPAKKRGRPPEGKT